jgi:hypothetical protein
MVIATAITLQAGRPSQFEAIMRRGTSEERP